MKGCGSFSRKKSFRYSPDQPFKLVSGRLSPYYIDCRPVTHNAQGLYLMGEIFFERLREAEVARGGRSHHGGGPHGPRHRPSPAFSRAGPINAFSVRKQAKEHGAGGLVVGDIKPGDRVAVLEDVVTTGGSTLKAIAAAETSDLRWSGS